MVRLHLRRFPAPVVGEEDEARCIKVFQQDGPGRRLPLLVYRGQHHGVGLQNFSLCQHLGTTLQIVETEIH